MADKKKQNFLHGAAIMTLTTIIVKIFGFSFKIPLGSMSLLGDEGYAHFLVAYNIYSFFLTLAIAGFPVALSRMISVAEELDRPAQVQRIFRVAIGVLAAIGGVFSLVMLLFHRQLAVMMGDPEAALSIVVLSPTVLIVCLTSAYRGYCQGRSNMIPTSIGQVIEEAGKFAIGLSAAWLLIRAGKGLAAASAGAIFGVTAGAVAALAYMFLYKKKNYPKPAQAYTDKPDSSKTILLKFLRIAIPIAVGSSVLSLVNLLDNGLCLNRLQSSAGFTSQEANILYGAYGKAQMFYNLPSYFITPLTLTIVPAIATAMARERREEASSLAASSLRIAAVIILPLSIGIGVLAEPIFRSVYWGSNPAGPGLLRWLCVAAFFVCMAMMCNSILQAGGREELPVISIVVGGVVKIAVNWVLVGTPSINIHGAPVGSIFCFASICALDYYFLCRTLQNRPRLRSMLGAPLLSSVVMGAAARGVYELLVRAVFASGDPSRKVMALSMLISIAAAAAVYLVMISVTRAVTQEDMSMIPRGEKLGRLLHLRKKNPSTD